VNRHSIALGFDFQTMSQLNDNQRSTLETFREIASIDDEYLCIQILQQSNWNLDAALNQFVGGQGDDNDVDAQIPPPRSTSGNAVRRANRGNDAPIVQQTRPAPTTQPLTALQPQGNAGLFGLLLVPLRWLFQAHPTSLNPEQDTIKFIDEYNLSISANHPTFHRGSYQSAVATAFQRSKFLVLYLHSPLHEDSGRFCIEVLGNASVINYLNQNALVWAGRVWDPEAYGLSTQLRATCFPFIGLLICQSNRTVQIADRIQGHVDATVFMERLQNSMGAFNAVLTRNQQENNRREEATRLRAQQDEEYRAAMRADEDARVRARAEEAKRESEEEERRQQEELAEAVELSKKLTQQDTIRKLRESLPTEPDTGAVDVSTIRFQLPTGKKLSRRFAKTDTIQIVFNFLTLHFDELGEAAAAAAAADSVGVESGGESTGTGGKITNFSICTHFPKVELTDMTQTIESAGLHPRGMLYVQDLDA